MAELISKEGNKVQFKVSVPAAEVNRAHDQVWAALARDVRVPGFRPGKAPRKVIEGRVGKDYVQAQVRDRLLDTAYPQALRELGLNLVEASIDPQDIKSGEAFDFTVTGETYPEVKLGDWKQHQVKAQAPEITDEVLEQTLNDLRERNATFEKAERPIEAADQVTIQELGEEGSEEGGTYPIYLDMAEEHVRSALMGKNAGDVVEITVPAHQHGDHEHPEHTVRVKVTDVKTKKLQDLNDEFAGSLNYDSMDKLRTELRGELERRAQQEGENLRREEFVDALVEGMTVEIPEALIRSRREGMMAEIQDDLRRQGVSWKEYETFMREQGKLEEFEADLTKNAEVRVRRDLALGQLAQDLDVNVSEMEFNQTLTMLAQSNGMQPQQLVDQLGQQGLQSYYGSLLRERGLQRALAQLTGEDKQGEKVSEEKADAQEGDKAAEQTEETKSEE